MKSNILSMILMFAFHNLSSQTEGLELLAHFPLIEHFGDITGQLDSLDYSHVEFRDDALYFDGADRTSDTSNQVQISLRELNLDAYFISLDVKIDSITGSDQLIRTIFEIEAGQQWMTFFVNQNSQTFQIGRSGGGTVVPRAYRPNQWYNVGISYHKNSKTRNFYLDGVLAHSDTFTIESDRILTSFGLGILNFGWWPMKGYWKNLQIHGSTAVPSNGPIAGRKLLAHYPLDSDFEDATGQEDTLQTAHVEITDEGLYFDGADPFSDTANIARVRIEELDLDDYYISFEVKIDSVVDDGIQSINLRHIFTGGLGWRWMRAIVNQEFGFISMLRSGGFANITLPYETDRWYTMGLYYNRKNLEGRFYLDGQLVIRDSFDLVGNNDKFIGIGCTCGPWPFKGHWKNLMVYGPDTRTIPLSLSCQENSLPSNESSTDGSIEITIDGGFKPYQVSWNGGDTTFAEVGTYIIPNLGLGTYNLEIRDSAQVRQTCETVLQIPGQLPLIAHYPLQGNLQDKLMQNSDIQIENVELRDSALYINGAENFTDTSNFILASRINKLNHDEFEIRLQFKLDSISTPGVSQRRTVLLAGQSFRWAALYYLNDTKEFQLGYNNFNFSPQKIPMDFNRWYDMSITYNRKVRMLALFIDGIKVDAVETDLITGVDQSIALNCCSRAPMKGFWKNLKVYSSEKVVIPDITLHKQTLEWNGSATSTDGAMRVAINGGDGPFIAELFFNETRLDSQSVFGREVEFENLAVGPYQVTVSDRFDSVQVTDFELLPPQTQLPIQSYYPMDLSLFDTSGIHRPLALQNAEHIFGEGISIPGNSNIDNSMQDQVSTTLEEINHDNFYISMNITIDSIDGLSGGDKRSIFIGGQFWRWMYPHYFQSSQRIGLTYNNFGQAPETFEFEYGQEYEIAMAYNRTTQVGQLFIDRIEITRDTFDMETGDDVSFGLNCNCGPSPMKGFWRKLRVYSAPPDSATVSNNDLETRGPVKIYPNPGSSLITITLPQELVGHESILWYDLAGRQVKSHTAKGFSDSIQVDISDLGKGTYVVRIGPVFTKFIKF